MLTSSHARGGLLEAKDCSLPAARSAAWECRRDGKWQVTAPVFHQGTLSFISSCPPCPLPTNRRLKGVAVELCPQWHDVSSHVHYSKPRTAASRNLQSAQGTLWNPPPSFFGLLRIWWCSDGVQAMFRFPCVAAAAAKSTEIHTGFKATAS